MNAGVAFGWVLAASGMLVVVALAVALSVVIVRAAVQAQSKENK